MPPSILPHSWTPDLEHFATILSPSLYDVQVTTSTITMELHMTKSGSRLEGQETPWRERTPDRKQGRLPTTTVHAIVCRGAYHSMLHCPSLGRTSLLTPHHTSTSPHASSLLHTTAPYHTTPHRGTTLVTTIACARSLSVVSDLGAPQQRNGCSPHY